MDRLPKEIALYICNAFLKRKDFVHLICTCKYLNRLFCRYLDPSLDDNKAIKWSSRHGNEHAVRFLLGDERVDPSSRNQQAIRFASGWGHSKVIKELLNHPKVDPCVQDNQAIRWAAEMGHVDVVYELLKDPRVDPCASGGEAIYFALFSFNIKLMEVILKDERVQDYLDSQNHRYHLDEVDHIVKAIINCRGKGCCLKCNYIGYKIQWQ